MANTNYVQATIELFGFFITIIIAMIFQIITVNRKKSEEKLFHIILFSGFALLFDAGWYIFDGNTSRIGYTINSICNFSIFICNPIMIYLLNYYLCNFLKEENERPNKVVVIVLNVFVVLTLIIPVSNIFYKWMYYIDSQNVYHRLFGWSVYTVLNCASIICCMCTVAVHRKYISARRRIPIYIFLMAPFVGIVIQSTKIGISFIQLGIAIGSLGIVLSYLVDWIRRDKIDGDFSEDKRRLWLIECIFGIMILFVSASIISCVVSVNKVSNKNSEQSSLALSYMVSETVNGALSEPINVSRTMAESYIIRKALSEEKLEGTDIEKDMLSFMKRIKDEYGYQMIFVSSTKTKAYYTYEGLSRYMDVDHDPNDAWYNDFMGRGIQYELNIDEDKDNNMELAVFVNMEVRDENDNLIGICGVGTSIESLLDILSKYEDEYSLDITLTDTKGIIQVDRDRSRIGQESQYEIEPSTDSEVVNYVKNNTSAKLTKYMEGLDWYMIINDNNPNKLNVIEIILPSMVIYMFGVIFMLAFSFGFAILERKRIRQLSASRLLSEIDRLTGVKNRNAFEKYQKEFNAEELLNDHLIVVMMDINGLKTVNDKYGHIAGDELIIGATTCIKDSIGSISEIYRVGGDEFIAISHENKDIIEEKIKVLKDLTAFWKGDLVNELAVSIGIANSQDEGNKNLNDLVKKADERMYADKNAYYRRTGKDRRMSW